MQTKVLSLKARPPIEGIGVVAEQASAAHRYYNRLIELHREFAAAREDAKRRHCPALAPAEEAVAARVAAVDELRGQIKARNAAARRKTATAEDRAALATARGELAAARDALRTEREAARLHPGYQADLAAMVVQYHGTLTDPNDLRSRRTGGRFKDARRDCGVYPGTYLRIEAAVEQAVADSIGQPLRFRRWDGSALCGPQLVPPLPVADALSGADRRLCIERLPSPSAERRSDRLLAWVRVGSADRDPVWAKVPCHLSKGELPADAVITWAAVVRRQVGMRRHKHPEHPEGVYLPYYEWSVQLTIRTGAKRRRAKCGTAGVNVGWRTQGDGTLRVATLVDHAGHTEHFELPKRIIDRFRRAADIQQIRDGYFNSAKLALVTWLANAAVPDWFREKVQHIDQWRSLRRLAGVCDFWTRNRFAGDESAYPALREWRDRDCHLEQYELMVRAGAVRRRTALYRQFAARLRNQYATVVVDGTDYRTLKRRPVAEDNSVENATAKYHAQIASPGALRAAILHAGAVVGPTADITRRCHACGAVEDFDQQRELTHTCGSCEADWDQDVNAARNLLASAPVVNETPDTARGPEDDPGPGDTPADEQSGGKWARRKRNRSQQPSGELAGKEVA